MTQAWRQGVRFITSADLSFVVVCSPDHDKGHKVALTVNSFPAGERIGR